MGGVTLLQFTVAGRPQSQGSLAHNRAGVLYQKPQLVMWRDLVHEVALLAARRAGVELPIDAPVTVEAHFYMPRPKRPRFHVPAVQPDLDKLQRAVGDALSPKHGARILQDDSRIVSWHATKHYETGEHAAGVTITIREAT